MELDAQAAKPPRLTGFCRRLVLISGALVASVLIASLALVLTGFNHTTMYDPRYWYGGWSADDDDDDDDPIMKLKSELHKLSASEAAKRFGKLSPKVKTPPRQQKIDHVVVLYMENRPADHFFGCMDLPGFDGIRGGHSFPQNAADPTKGSVQVTCGTAEYVCRAGPDYDTFASKFPPGGNASIFPYSNQSDKFSAAHGAWSSLLTAVRMFSPEQVPIKHALAKAYGVFNRMYTSVPSASSPNHLFTQSATSCGMDFNGLYNDCYGATVTFPQMTIYDNLRLHNVSFNLFMNSTCGLDEQPCHGENPHNPDSASAINTPDVAMAGVARHKDRFASQEAFYKMAADGSLPGLSWILPPIQASDHPCHDVAKGERLLKDVYEAVRNGPGWAKTLMIVAYDDAGGFYDHVVPPYTGVPADDAPCHIAGPLTDPPYTCPGGAGPAFDFRRLGLRTAAMLISPWVAKGAVFQEPKRGPTATSQFDLTSIPATIKNLFNLSHFLTKRDAWAGNFEELLLDAPRPEADMPYHLPEAPKPAAPWDPPPPDARVPTPGDGHFQRDIGDDDDDHQRRLLLSTVVGVDGSSTSPTAPIAQHCSNVHGSGSDKPCRGHTKPNLKQRRNVKLFTQLIGVPAPNVDAMSFSEVDQWLAKHWRLWMDMGGPVR